jgi:tetratricopeptide (TPR) repeat protein
MNRTEQLLNMLEKEPEDVFLNYALGLEYSTLPEFQQKAEEQFKKVLTLDTGYLAAYYQLGQLFTLLNKHPEALTYYKSGLEKAREQKNNKAINEFGEAIFMLED